MPHIDFISQIHKKTKRNYLERVERGDKAECAGVAKQFDFDYWDGDRKYGYGGYRYDGRWEPVARDMIAHYGLKDGDRVLDVGCGKAFLLYEFKKLLPGLDIRGIDASTYALENAKEEAKPFLQQGTAQALPYDENTFDLVYSITTLHNLYIFDLAKALSEIERVRRGGAHVVVEAYRTEEEKANLLHWQLTCECFFTPEEWQWLYQEFGYTGDYSFIYFD